MHTHQFGARRAGRFAAIGVAAVVFVASCTHTHQSEGEVTVATPSLTDTYLVHDTILAAVFDAAGVAAPIQQATLSTKLMGTVTDVRVKEGDRVTTGQPLVRIDARDLAAKSAQVSASVADAEAVHRDALTQANRMRALFADSAATRAQLDAAATELGAIASYSAIRAPFAGIITKRFVDPGAFAAPGSPLIAIQDVSTLRISANTTPEVARELHRGQSLAATIEGQPVTATVEGAVPSIAGNLYTINALVANRSGMLLAGSTATITVPTGTRTALVVPASAIVREGDLTGVTLRTAQGDERRWVRLGQLSGSMIEIAAGVGAGDRVVLTLPRSVGAAEN